MKATGRVWPPLLSTFTSALLVVLTADVAWAQGVGDLAAHRVVDGLSSPLFVTSPPNDPRLFIIEQRGLIWIFKNGQKLATPFLDVDAISLCCSERGLLGLVFTPDYETSGEFFINYIDNSGNTAIARYLVSADPDVADAASGEILLTIVQPGSNHNGGHIAFGPNDGYLYIGMGDGGPSTNSQDPSTLHAKMLRLDVSAGYGNGYAIPPDNPFVGPGDPPDEVWAQGLRNPYRWSFDRTKGDLYIADVGAGLREEINVQSADSPGGENYGWDIMEGDLCNNPIPPGCSHPSLTPPVHVYGHTQGRCSITGGYVYRGSSPRFKGRYFFGDFCTGEVWSFTYDPAAGVQGLINHSASIGTDAVVGFGEDASGELYVVDYDGEVYKIVETPFAYILDGFGGLHAAGSAPVISPAPRYFGMDMAVDMELTAAGGIYVLDRFGGLHAGGGAPVMAPAPPYFGFNVAIDVELRGTGAYVLDRWGGVHPAGGASTFAPRPPYWSFDFARDIEIAGTGIWLLDQAGGIHVGGTAGVFSPAPPYFGFNIARDLELARGGAYVLDGFGGLHAAGGARPFFPAPPYFGFDVAQDMEITGTGEVYVLDRLGALHFGGGAQPAVPAPPYFGFNVARDLELR